MPYGGVRGPTGHSYKYVSFRGLHIYMQVFYAFPFYIYLYSIYDHGFPSLGDYIICSNIVQNDIALIFPWCYIRIQMLMIKRY